MEHSILISTNSVGDYISVAVDVLTWKVRYQRLDRLHAALTGIIVTLSSYEDLLRISLKSVLEWQKRYTYVDFGKDHGPERPLGSEGEGSEELYASGYDWRAV